MDRVNSVNLYCTCCGIPPAWVLLISNQFLRAPRRSYPLDFYPTIPWTVGVLLLATLRSVGVREPCASRASRAFFGRAEISVIVLATFIPP